MRNSMPGEPPTLVETQRWMKEAILRGGELPPSPKRRSPEVAHAERLVVYGEGYPARLLESLKEVFPAVVRILGHDGSHELIEGYLQAHPSKSYNISFALDELDVYLRKSKFIAPFPFIADLAGLEIRLNRAFHARHRSVADLGEFQNLPPERWEKARFRFQPSVAVMTSDWPLERIRLGTVSGTEKEPSSILIYRKDADVMIASIETGMRDLLEPLLEGKTLGEACERLPNGVAPEKLFQWFGRWMELGLIAGCDFA